MRRRVVWLAGIIAGLGSSEIGAQRDPATTQNVVGELEESEGSTRDHLIFVINRSSENIIVTSVRLLECENVQGSCATIRRKTRVLAGGRVMVHRVRPRFPDQSFSFRYTFTWEPEAPEGPTAKDVLADSTVLVVDTVIVTPMVLDVKVGETIDLGQVLGIKALNRKGDPVPEIWFYPTVEMGGDRVTLDRTKLTGTAPGTAVLSIGASRVAMASGGSTKGATKILVTVIP